MITREEIEKYAKLGKSLDVAEEFTDKIIDGLELTELSYWIEETSEPDFYEPEIESVLMIFALLGYTKKANAWLTAYKERIEEE